MAGAMRSTSSKGRLADPHSVSDMHYSLRRLHRKHAAVCQSKRDACHGGSNVTPVLAG